MDKKKIIRKYNNPFLEKQEATQTLNTLKKAWKQLPSDFTTSERSLFIEVAERLVKMASDAQDRLN